MSEAYYPQLSYRFRSCSEQIRIEAIGGQDLYIHELTPDQGGYVNFASLLSYCSWLVGHQELVILYSSEAEILIDLTPLGFAHGTDFFLYKHFFKETSVIEHIAYLHIERMDRQTADTMKLANCLQALADSIGDCLVLPLFLPTIRNTVGWSRTSGFLIGPPILMASVMAIAGLSLAETPHGRAKDILSNLEVLDYVSPRAGGQNKLGDHLGEAGVQDGRSYFTNLGQCFAALHGRRILPDAHLANFIQTRKSGNVKLVDLDPPFTVLLRPAGPRECAANLVSILMELDSEQWGWFKEGYTEWLGDRGASTVALLEGQSIPAYEEFLTSERCFEAVELLLEAINMFDQAGSGERLKQNLANLGFCLSRIGEYRAAVQAYERAVHLTDSRIERMAIQFNMAKAFYRSGETRNAIQAFETVREFVGQPTEEVVSLLVETLAALVLAYDEIDQGQACLDRADALFRLLEKFKGRGIALHPDMERTISIAYATQNVRSNPADMSALLERANIYRQFSSWISALKDLDRATQLEPANIEVLLERASLYFYLEKYDLAEDDLSKAIELAPDDERPVQIRADLYKQTSQYEKQVADLGKMVKHYPRDTKWLIARADAYLSAEEYESALADISDAISMDAHDSDLLLMRGQWLSVMGRLQESLADFDRATDMLSKSLDEAEVNGNNDRATSEALIVRLGFCCYLRGKALMEVEKYEQAVLDFSRAIEFVPYRSMYRVARCLANQKLGRLDDALEDMDLLIEKGSYSWNHFLRRGVVRRLKGELEGALADLLKAKEYWLKFPWASEMPAVDQKMEHEGQARWSLSEHVS